MNARWILGWAAAWVALTFALIAWWWPIWASICSDCVPTGNPGDYGGTRYDIDWVPTLLAAGLVAALVVLLAAVVGRRVLRRGPVAD
jgi:hypothetical protein